MGGRTAVVTGPWVTIKENLIHPDHDGVVGDLLKHRETGRYQLLEYRGDEDNYVRYTVPYRWAKRHDDSA